MADSKPTLNKNILLVATDPDLREFASSHLEAAGFFLDIVDHGEDGRLRLAGTSYALIIFDDSSLGLSCFRSELNLFQQKNSHCEFMITVCESSDLVSEDRLHGLEVFDTLTRPISKRRFLNAVARAVEKHEMSKKETLLNENLLSKNLELQTVNSNLLEALEESKTLQAYLASSQKLAGIGEMTARGAHEFNNVLGAIRGYSQLALRNPGNPDELMDLHRKIKRAVDRAVDVVGNLLDCTSRVSPKQEEADINIAIEETVELSRQHLNLKGIQVRSAYGLLPKFAFNVGQLQQVFLNLITNASHAIGKGGFIQIYTAMELDRVCIRFEDSGKGIEKDLLDKIFVPFFTTKTPSNGASQEKGSGLGLHVSRQIIEAHKGAIEVESAIGQGTSFTIYLPLTPAVLRRTPMASEEEKKDEPAPLNLSKLQAKALVVDDEDDIRGILRRFLEDKGLEVWEAADGIECLEVLENTEIDLLFLDIMMPNLNGLEAQSKIYKDHPGIKVFMMSGYSPQMRTNDGLPDGVYHFLAKPFDLDVLDKLIQEALRPAQSHA